MSEYAQPKRIIWKRVPLPCLLLSTMAPERVSSRHSQLLQPLGLLPLAD